ncbi:MAG: hypothetical protein J2P16_00365, partial [Mycobacterium sp.]|nr:hypothetical protein [Mycobacterium sp.]
LLGEDVLAWAEDHVHGPTTAEALGMVCLVACLASLHDALSQPDAAHELFTAVFASSPEVH